MVEVRFSVRLTPRGGTDRIDGVDEQGVLRARVVAPAVDGAANEALVRLLARELDAPRSAVRIVTGAATRKKLVAVVGTAPEALIARWPGLRV